MRREEEAVQNRQASFSAASAISALSFSTATAVLCSRSTIVARALHSISFRPWGSETTDLQIQPIRLEVWNQNAEQVFFGLEELAEVCAAQTLSQYLMIIGQDDSIANDSHITVYPSACYLRTNSRLLGDGREPEVRR